VCVCVCVVSCVRIYKFTLTRKHWVVPKNKLHTQCAIQSTNNTVWI